MKRYRGVRDRAGDPRVVVTYKDRRGYERMRPLALVNPRHSPDGFEWGYAGSGPAELARQLLRDVFGRRMLDRPWVYQQFKASYVQHWGDTWDITEQTIREWAYAGKHDVGPHSPRTA